MTTSIVELQKRISELEKKCADFEAILKQPSEHLVLLQKKYDGESIVDCERDLSEAFQSCYTPLVQQIPTDAYGFFKGVFHVSVVWEPWPK